MFSIIQWKINRINKKIKALKSARINNQPSDQQLKKEINYYYSLSAIYKKLVGTRTFPYAQEIYIECYRAAAELEDSLAHYELGTIFLDEARFRERLNQESFSSVANIKQSEQLYKEAHAHLLAAEQLGNIKAKRLRGLAFVNGWGILADKNLGFELIVASIEQEQSWDKVPKIFAEMGLNNPEFFSAIMQRRKGSN